MNFETQRDNLLKTALAILTVCFASEQFQVIIILKSARHSSETAKGRSIMGQYASYL